MAATGGSADYFVYIIKYELQSRMFGTVFVEKFFRFRSLLGEFLGYPFPERLHLTFRNTMSSAQHFSLASDTDWRLLHSEVRKECTSSSCIPRLDSPGSSFYLIPLDVKSILPPDIDPNPSLKLVYTQTFKVRTNQIDEYLVTTLSFTNFTDLCKRLKEFLHSQEELLALLGKKKEKKEPKKKEKDPGKRKTLIVLDKERVVTPLMTEARAVKREDEEVKELTIGSDRELAYYLILHREKIRHALDSGAFADALEPIMLLV